MRSTTEAKGFNSLALVPGQSWVLCPVPATTDREHNIREGSPRFKAKYHGVECSVLLHFDMHSYDNKVILGRTGTYPYSKYRDREQMLNHASSTHQQSFHGDLEKGSMYSKRRGLKRWN